MILQQINIHGIDLVIVIAYMAAIPAFGFYFKRFVKDEQDYFLAGRMLPWWIISLSIIGTNIGATDYVGAAGGAYRFGITQAHYEWIGAIPAIILSALLFIPYYWKAGIYTVPEFLGRRYNQLIRVVQTILWGAFMVFLLGQFFWASGLMLEEYIGIPLTVEILGLPIYIGIVLTALIIGLYTISGGLAAVAMTDVIQVLVMFIGGIMLSVLGLWALGGWSGLVNTLSASHPDHLRLFLPADHPVYPWPGVIFGLAFVASPAWWCCNQAIIQRTLGARSEWDAKAGMLFSAIPKTLIPVITILPGLIALALNPNLVGPEMDKAYPWLIKTLLPTGLAGLVFASFIAALISSVDSVVNSAATLWTRDLYQALIVKNASSRHYLLVGRIMTASFIVIAIFIAPVMTRFPGLFVAGQAVLSIFQGPTFAITLLGIYWRRANRIGATCGLFGGVAIAVYLFAKMEISYFYYSWWSFVAGLLITLVVSALTRPESTEKLEGLVYGLVMSDAEIQKRLGDRAESGGEE